MPAIMRQDKMAATKGMLRMGSIQEIEIEVTTAYKTQ